MRDPGHLPNLRPGGEAAKPDWLPRQREGTTPQMIGRYPDYDVLASASDWDEATRKVVIARLGPAAELCVLHGGAAPTLRAFCDVLLAQDAEPRVPVVEMIDEKLAGGRLDGYEYEDMPDDRETWRLVLRGLDATAQQWHGKQSFAECAAADQEGIVKAFAAARLAAGMGGARTCRARGRCARGWRSRRSTRTRGRGTRSASGARPTRRATCASAR